MPSFPLNKFYVGRVEEDHLVFLRDPNSSFDILLEFDEYDSARREADSANEPYRTFKGWKVYRIEEVK